MQLSRTIIPTWIRIFQVRPLGELRVKHSCPRSQAHSFSPADKATSCGESISGTFLGSFVLSGALNIRGHPQTQGYLQKWLLSPYALLSRISGLWTNLFLHSRARARWVGNNTDHCGTPTVLHLRVRSTSYWCLTCNRHVLGCTSKEPFNCRCN